MLCFSCFMDSFICLRDVNTAHGWQDSATEHKVQVLVPDEWDAANFTAPHKSCCAATWLMSNEVFDWCLSNSSSGVVGPNQEIPYLAASGQLLSLTQAGRACFFLHFRWMFLISGVFLPFQWIFLISGFFLPFKWIFRFCLAVVFSKYRARAQLLTLK